MSTATAEIKKCEDFDPNRVYEFPLEEIFADSDFNSRGVIDPTTILELAKSIHDRGLDQPIMLQPWTMTSRPLVRFRIIAGYRRYMAHRINKAPTIRALVKCGLTDLDARILNLTENLHRQDLNPLQEALAIEQLKNGGLSQPQVAAKIGKSRGWVQERFYLLEMPDAIKEDVAAGLVSLKHVRIAWKMESVPEQLEYIKAVKDAKLKGNKREVNPDKVQVKSVKKLRSLEEIYELQDIIRETMGNCLATKALAWAGGILDDYEMHKGILEWATRFGKYYSIPEGLVPKADDSDNDSESEADDEQD